MSGVFGTLFRFFLSWWGAFLMGALDTTLLFFLPFGIDALVIFLSARDRELFWAYPLLAATGSVAGAAFTFWIGRKIGEAGVERILPPRRFERLKQRVGRSGAIALALPALLPPPFPFTPFILTCGALDVSRTRFFGTLAATRLLRFGAEGALARLYGDSVLAVLRSGTFQLVISGFIVVAVVGTIASAVLLWRSTHRPGSTMPARP